MKLWPFLFAGGALLTIAAFWKKGTMPMLKLLKQGIINQVLPAAAIPLVPAIMQVANEDGVSPWLIAGILNRESAFGLALRSDMTGDQGHGRGLMQIDDRYHGPWLAANDWKNPYLNIKKGVEIYKMNVAYFSRQSIGFIYIPIQVAARLGVASGNYNDPRPLKDELLIQASLAAYNAGPSGVLMALAAGKSPDTMTTGGNYGDDVMTKMNNWSDLAARKTV